MKPLPIHLLPIHLLLVTNDRALITLLAELLAAGNVGRTQQISLTTLPMPELGRMPLAAPAQPACDVVLVDVRGALAPDTLGALLPQLPAAPVLIVGDDIENLEDPGRVTIWQQVGVVDYLLRDQLTGHWLRHALLQAIRHTPPLPTLPPGYADHIWQLLDKLFADVPVLICAFTGPDHVYRYANPLYLEVVGRRDIVGKPIRAALPELEGQNIYELLDYVYASGKPYHGQEQQVWLQSEVDGTSREHQFAFVYAPVALPTPLTSAPLTSAPPPEPTQQAPDQKMIFVVAQDVSELVRLRRQWQEAHAQLNALFASAPLGLAFIDRDLRFSRINPALAEMNGIPADDHIGKSPDVLLPGLQEIDQILEQWRQIIATGTPLIGIEVMGRTPAAPDQDQIWEEIWFPVLLGDDVLGLGIVAENVTQRKYAEAEREHLLAVLARERAQLDELNQTLEKRVHERSRQVRSLATELTLAEQRERHRIAQILHDHIQQLLYGIDFRIALLADSASTDQQELLQEFKGIVQEAIRATRTLAVDLSPPVLQGEGLVKALHWLVHQMQDIHALQVILETQEPLEVAQIEMRVLVLQSVRELLFNVVKHADTTKARVIVRQEMHKGVKRLIVEVIDHGRGFDLAAQALRQREPETFGLYSIRERLHLFGGQLDLASVPGDGTRVTLVLPIAESID